MNLEPGVIVSIEDVQLNDFIKCTYPKQISNELLEAIKSTNITEVERLLKEFFNVITEIKIPYYKYQLILMQLLINLIELIESLGFTHDEAFEKRLLFDELNSLNTIHEIEYWFKESIIPVIMDKYSEVSSTQHSNITDMVCSIIHDEFYKDLTLENVSERINFHPSYVSRVFKKETGLTFSDYLMRYRINKVKKLLREGNMKIAEIAQTFHYNSSASFIRSFKKIEGMTPGQYRKKYSS